ncbi:MAG: hypothetical protein Q8P18_33835 [Pseudomonadota bacterium]|nr:hypothetical protein [Pseudomonadota bacterium]
MQAPLIASVVYHDPEAARITSDFPAPQRALRARIAAPVPGTSVMR